MFFVQPIDDCIDEFMVGSDLLNFPELLAGDEILNCFKTGDGCRKANSWEDGMDSNFLHH